MRFLGAVLVVGLFVAALVGGGKALGLWEPPPPVEWPNAQPTPESTGTASDDANPPATPAPSAGEGGCPEGVENDADEGEAAALLARLNPRDPQERLNGRDEKLARNAVLRRSNLGVCWKPVGRSPNGGPVRCSGHDPDLSRFTITGRAGSAFADRAAAIVSSVSIFADARQASEYFDLTATRSALGCIRAELKSHLEGEGVSPRLEYARMRIEPPIGEQTTIYTLRFSFHVAGHTGRGAYPVEILVFRTGRAIGAVSFSGIGALDREMRMAQLVASRLWRS